MALQYLNFMSTEVPNTRNLCLVGGLECGTPFLGLSLLSAGEDDKHETTHCVLIHAASDQLLFLLTPFPTRLRTLVVVSGCLRDMRFLPETSFARCCCSAAALPAFPSTATCHSLTWWQRVSRERTAVPLASWGRELWDMNEKCYRCTKRLLTSKNPGGCEQD